MRRFFWAIIDFLVYYPNAEMIVIYKISSKTKGGPAVLYTRDKKLARRLKRSRNIKIRRKLICRVYF
jgi:hypothetical protein